MPGPVMTMQRATVSRIGQSPGAAGGVESLKGRDVFVSLAPGVLGLADLDEDEWLEPDWRGFAWQDLSLCSQADSEAWFPEKGGSTAYPKKVCRRCPVISECLEFALENDERFGVFGGLSVKERDRLKRDRLKREAA
jgi:WhiB family redox-sensing transcriptional regulator